MLNKKLVIALTGIRHGTRSMDKLQWIRHSCLTDMHWLAGVSTNTWRLSMLRQFTWARRHPHGYECSTKGDKRFSALIARMPDGRTLEMHYQCDVKGYDVGGTNWRAGKGRPPLVGMSQGHQWEAYLNLWRIWVSQPENQAAMQDLYEKAYEHGVLTDMFAGTHINQAHALATIINEVQNASPR